VVAGSGAAIGGVPEITGGDSGRAGLPDGRGEQADASVAPTSAVAPTSSDRRVSVPGDVSPAGDVGSSTGSSAHHRAVHHPAVPVAVHVLAHPGDHVVTPRRRWCAGRVRADPGAAAGEHSVRVTPHHRPHHPSVGDLLVHPGRHVAAPVGAARCGGGGAHHPVRARLVHVGDLDGGGRLGGRGVVSSGRDRESDAEAGGQEDNRDDGKYPAAPCRGRGDVVREGVGHASRMHRPDDRRQSQRT